VKYLIWAYDYSHASSGPKALHRLCHELNLAGQHAAIGNGYLTNPEWNTPHGEPDDDTIAIYPEVVTGNPWGASRVVRWVLNVPGKLGGDKVYDPAEVVFSWDRAFFDAPLLNIPHIETDIYADHHEPREGRLYYVGKGAGSAHDAAPVTLGMRLDRYALADALNHAELLYSFDDCTAMTAIALLCGCPVRVVPTGDLLAPDGYREMYLARWPIFQQQLADFIRITQ
jgi:O-antigen biosynthesis protein